MQSVSGRPFLAYLLDQLVDAGFAEVILATRDARDRIREVFQDFYRGLRLHYSTAPHAAEGLDWALVMYGDYWCDASLGDFVRAHFESGAANSRAANAPLYLLSRETIESIPWERDRELSSTLPRDRMREWHLNAICLDIARPDDLKIAERVFKPKPRGIVFLDRDGTVNVEQNYLSSVDGMILLPRAAEAIRMLNQLGWPVVIVSNQTVVARGGCSIETLTAISGRMIELLAAEGAAVDGIYYCPHAPAEACACRKPRTRLLENAAWIFGARLDAAFLAGDKCSDIQAGLEAGAVTFLVRTGYGRETEKSARCAPHHVVDDLYAAAEQISRMINPVPGPPRHRDKPPRE